MMLDIMFFYGFAFCATIGALSVVLATNPVYSVLALIFTFFNVAGLFLMLGAEFVAMILIIVYVGAVAVLFLFVVMMLDVGAQSFKEKLCNCSVPALLMSLFLLIELLFLVSHISPVLSQNQEVTYPVDLSISNTKLIGKILYTDFVIPFQLAGLILFVAMIGAIALTLRVKPGVRRQDISKQLLRDQKSSVEMKQIQIGEGVTDVQY